jgi:hypothetical protein
MQRSGLGGAMQSHFPCPSGETLVAFANVRRLLIDSRSWDAAIHGF